MKAEYIDLDTPLEAYRLRGNQRDPISTTLRELLDFNKIPYVAADVQPVVRCKDCQNSYEWKNVDGDNYRYCGYLRDKWNRDYDRMVDDDDFCKWGRKMDGEA